MIPSDIELVNKAYFNGRGGSSLLIPYIGDHPITIYVGFVLFAFVLATAVMGYLYHKRIVKLPVKHHRNPAFISLGVAFIHGSLATIDHFFS